MPARRNVGRDDPNDAASVARSGPLSRLYWTAGSAPTGKRQPLACRGSLIVSGGSDRGGRERVNAARDAERAEERAIHPPPGSRRWRRPSTRRQRAKLAVLAGKLGRQVPASLNRSQASALIHAWERHETDALTDPDITRS
jgi:hypothetical protein